MHAMFRVVIVTFVMGILNWVIPAEAANFPLEITQPQPGLSTVNRYYKAYPGLAYEVRVAVIGGVYPFRFRLTSAPSGMTIDPDQGVIRWPSPIEAAAPHPIEVSVMDSEGAIDTVAWTITVTTEGFRFVDAVNGRSVANGGTGTHANPWRTIADWYEGNDYASKSARSYVGEFLYWRAGVYSLADAFKEDAIAGAEPGRMPVLANNKPVVWLAYPNERPIIEHGYVNGVADSGPFIIFYATSNHVYIDGLEFRNMKCKGFEISSDGSNQVFRNLEMHHMTYGEDGKNCAFIMTGTGSSGDHMVIQDSVFRDMNLATGGAFIKIYAKNKLLIEGNTLHTVSGPGSSDSEGIALKGGTMTRVTVRSNVVYGVPSRSIGGNMHTLADSEVLYNCVTNASSDALDINQDGLATNLYFYRNTILGRVQIRNTDASDGPFRLYNNVIVNDDPGAPAGSHVYHYQVSDPSRVMLENNLTGYPGDGITDATGNLQANYMSYVGTHGCQRTGYVPPASTDGTGCGCQSPGSSGAGGLAVVIGALWRIVRRRTRREHCLRSCSAVEL